MTEPTEKEARIYYQGIVYAICNIMDVHHGRKPGRGVVCGSVSNKTSELQNDVARLAARCRELRTVLARALHGECTWHHGSFMVEAEKILDKEFP